MQSQDLPGIKTITKYFIINTICFETLLFVNTRSTFLYIILTPFMVPYPGQQKVEVYPSNYDLKTRFTMNNSWWYG